MGRQTAGHFKGLISMDAREIQPPDRKIAIARYPNTLFTLFNNALFM